MGAANIRELQREISLLRAEINRLKRDNVSRPARHPDPGGPGSSSVRRYRVVEVPSGDGNWLFAERVVRGPEFGNAQDEVNYGRWIGISERDESTIMDKREQISTQSHLTAAVYEKFIRNWGPGDVTTRATPILRAEKAEGAWELIHPFFGVSVLEFSGETEIADCGIAGVQ